MQFHAITLNSVPEASYLTAENAWRYRAIMRTFYLESQKAHIRLNKTELLALLRVDAHFAEYTAEQLEQDLNALCSWRNLVPIQDPPPSHQHCRIQKQAVQLFHVPDGHRDRADDHFPGKS